MLHGIMRLREVDQKQNNNFIYSIKYGKLQRS